MNLRQFAYALGGGLAAFLIYTLFNQLGPSILGLIIAAPVALVCAFMALGKYNGRDAEIYLFKFIEFLKKPKSIMYKKQPQTPELDKRQKQLTGFMMGIIANWCQHC